jgi:hypothetical protein
VEKEESKKELFKSLEEAVEKYKTDKKEDILNQKKKSIEGDMAAINAEITVLQASLKELIPSLSPKVCLFCFLLF